VVEDRDRTIVYVADKRINAVHWRAHITRLTTAGEMVDDAVISLGLCRIFVTGNPGRRRLRITQYMTTYG
jgi:hypothetical protein